MNRKTVRAAAVVALVSTLTLRPSAQQPQPFTGNPTPGTLQPAPPNPADRITLTGCVEAVSPGGSDAPTTADPNTPNDSKFILTEAKRENRVPPDTGIATAASAATSRIYRLAAIDSALSPFVKTKVEISGEVLPSISNASGGGAAANAPTLRVEFVQKIARSCE
jgi:hypothetical protein